MVQKSDIRYQMSDVGFQMSDIGKQINGKWNTKMPVSRPAQDPPARRSIDKSELQQERLDHILNRVHVLGQG